MADRRAGGSHPPELGGDEDLDTAGGGQLPPWPWQPQKLKLKLGRKLGRIANSSPVIRKRIWKLQAVANNNPVVLKRMQEVLAKANYNIPSRECVSRLIYLSYLLSC